MHMHTHQLVAELEGGVAEHLTAAGVAAAEDADSTEPASRHGRRSVAHVVDDRTPVMLGRTEEQPELGGVVSCLAGRALSAASISHARRRAPSKAMAAFNSGGSNTTPKRHLRRCRCRGHRSGRALRKARNSELSPLTVTENLCPVPAVSTAAECLPMTACMALRALDHALVSRVADTVPSGPPRTLSSVVAGMMAPGLFLRSDAVSARKKQFQ
jgi:hypothetical protein